MNKIIFLLHIIAVLHFTYGIYYDLNYVKPTFEVKHFFDKINAPLKSRTVFLTFLNMVSGKYRLINNFVY